MKDFHTTCGMMTRASTNGIQTIDWCNKPCVTYYVVRWVDGVQILPGRCAAHPWTPADERVIDVMSPEAALVYHLMTS